LDPEKFDLRVRRLTGCMICQFLFPSPPPLFCQSTLLLRFLGIRLQFCPPGSLFQPSHPNILFPFLSFLLLLFFFFFFEWVMSFNYLFKPFPFPFANPVRPIDHRTQPFYFRPIRVHWTRPILRITNEWFLADLLPYFQALFKSQWEDNLRTSAASPRGLENLPEPFSTVSRFFM